MKKKLLSHKEFNYIYSKVPRLCVDLVICNGKKILLTKRSISPFRGFWHLPGGGVIYRETIREAIDRVAKEELGVKVQIKNFLGYLEILKEGHRHGIALEFKCGIIGKNKPLALEQASEFKFFNKIPKKTISKQKEFIETNWKQIIK